MPMLSLTSMAPIGQEQIKLSQLEKQSLLLFINCRSVRGISMALNVSFKSVDMALQRAKQKIGIYSKEELRLWAEDIKWVVSPHVILDDWWQRE